MTPEQKEIMQFAKSQGGYFTKKEAVKRFPYYCNSEKHIGDRLSRMVNAGLLERVSPGKFKVRKYNVENRRNPTINNPNQTELF